MDRKRLRSGYNFVERNLLGRKIEDVSKGLVQQDVGYFHSPCSLS